MCFTSIPIGQSLSALHGLNGNIKLSTHLTDCVIHGIIQGKAKKLKPFANPDQ